jgi:hypothetical protein
MASTENAQQLSREFSMKRFGRILCGTAASIFFLLSDSVLESRPTLAETSASNSESGDQSAANQCTVGVSEFPSVRSKTKELYFLMEKYFLYCHSDLSVLDEIYRAETRDEQWADPLEHKIRAAGEGAEGPKVTGECRRSLCRFDLESFATKRWGILDYNDRFRALSMQNHIVAHFVPSAQGGFTGYFYSDTSAPAFLDPFLRKMHP